jgi:hypothetical protein
MIISKSINDNLNTVIDKSSALSLKDPTGFTSPADIILTGNGDRTITLTGAVEAYWRGVKVNALVSGWTSTTHGTDITKNYYLYYNGTSYVWSDSVWTFDMLQICIASYNNEEGVWIYMRECHGLLSHLAHEEFHRVIGTYKLSGGTIGGYVLNSTTEANRRPDIGTTVIVDEDVPTTLTALSSKLYTHAFLTGASARMDADVEQADVIRTNAAVPRYNQFSGGSWGVADMPANSSATVWIYALPVAADVTSQKHRFFFVQPQWISQATGATANALAAARNAELARNITELNLGTMEAMSAEFIAIGRILIQYTASNWTVQDVRYLTGTKVSQVGSPAGNYLSGVSVDSKLLKGTGTAANPLSTNNLDGFWDYSDLATQSTPLAYTTGEMSLTCDGAGPYTLTTYRPYDITDIFDAVNGEFDFSGLAVGDELTVRTDIVVTTSANNQEVKLMLKCDIGGSPYYLTAGVWHFKTAGVHPIVATNHLYIGNAGTRDNPAEMVMTSDASASVVVNGFYVTTKRRYN